MTAAEPVRDLKAGFSTMCRRGDHRTCASAQAKCTCDCHGASQRYLAATKASTGRAVRATPPRSEQPEPVARPTTRRPAGDPVFELVKADPPEPPRKKTVAEVVRPLLEQILVADDHDWYRIVVFPSKNRANFVISRLRNAYSKAEWEWRGVKLEEVDQSAVYVRWIGEDEGRALAP